MRLDRDEVASSGVRISGQVGDGRSLARDVDLYRIILTRGQRLIIDVDAAELPSKSPLDSYLRLFSGGGRQITFNDDFNGSADSLISFTASARRGVYYVGVSGFGNTTYRAGRPGSGVSGSTGSYEISFSIAAASQAGQTVTTMGFRDTTDGRNGIPSAFASLAGNWIAAQQAQRHESLDHSSPGGFATKRWIMRWR